MPGRKRQNSGFLPDPRKELCFSLGDPDQQRVDDRAPYPADAVAGFDLNNFLARQEDRQPMNDFRHYLVGDTLRNGTAVTIRAIRPEDKTRLISAFKHLDPESVYSRFFHYVRELTDQDLRRATEIDFDREVALVVTTLCGDEETIIGAGRYVVCEEADSGRSAELAFMVEEDYQGLGIASRLLRHLVQIGRQKNVSRFTADVLSGNRAILRVIAGSGLPIKQQPDGTLVRVTLSLDETDS